MRLAILIALLTASTALAFPNPFRIFRHGRKDIEQAEQREWLDRDLPGALKRMAWTVSENWWVRGAAGLVLAHLGWLGKGWVERRRVSKAKPPKA